MDGEPTPAWWPTRILLAIGIGAVLVPVFLLVATPTGSSPMFGPPPGFRAAVSFVTVAGYLGMLVGLAWMIRIFRGPRDEPPPWRYRDR